MIKVQCLFLELNLLHHHLRVRSSQIYGKLVPIAHWHWKGYKLELVGIM